MVRKKNRVIAGNGEWKLSDQRDLDSDGRIIAALKNKKPLEVDEICKLAKIDRSTFYRHYRVLSRHSLVKKVGNKYALWDYNEIPSSWERVQKRLLAAGGPLVKLEIEKLRLGERDPVTGWCKKIFDRKVTVDGVVIFKAAKELCEAARITIGDEYNAALITNGPVDSGDRFFWHEYVCNVWRVDKIYEGNEVSYRILYLINGLNR